MTPSSRPTRQRTLAGDFSLSGIGVHSGEHSSVAVRPAPTDHGIRFVRTDLDRSPEIPASLDSVSATGRGTALASEGVSVSTVEHLLAALAAFGVDNARIEVAGPELPIRDGSFVDFASSIDRVGTREQDADATTMAVSEPLAWTAPGGASYVAVPAPELILSVSIEFPPPIGAQFGSFRVGADSFQSQIAPARTFGFQDDAEELRAQGLALGTSHENTVVLGNGSAATPELRFPDEFVRHKAGDLLGDLSLVGGRIQARVIADRPGHAGNVGFARVLVEAATKQGREPVLSIQEIMRYLPHRYPMLLVDRITAFEPGRRIVGIKNVTINEPFFRGHYPGHPVMPGVLIVEAMAQVGGLLLMDQVDDPEDKVVYFMSLDKVKWRRPVVPGDTVVFDLELAALRGRNCRMRGKGYVEGVRVAEAELMARIVDR